MVNHVAHFLEVLADSGDRPGLHHGRETFTYRQLWESSNRLLSEWTGKGVQAGSILRMEGDFSQHYLAGLVTCLRMGVVCVPQATGQAHPVSCEFRFCTQTGLLQEESAEPTPRTFPQPSVVIFTSGTSGTPKGIVLDLNRSLALILRPGQRYRTVLMFQPDHWGGWNTILYTLAQGGSLITVGQRTVSETCEAIQSHRAELLPTTPSFLSFLLAADAVNRWDLGSLRLVSFGAESMPPSLLKSLEGAFPRCRLKQTYGLTELGVIPVESDGVWIRPKVEFKVEEGRLKVRSPGAMTAYLHPEPSPVDENGWMDTGDRVQEKEGWLRVVGRDEERINVGGQKVFPQEIEETILKIDFVADATVSAESNALLGQVPVAQVTLRHPVPRAEARSLIRAHCRRHLSAFKIPTRIELVEHHPVSRHGKRLRGTSP